MKAKPFIKWVGGKTQLIEQLEALLPADFDKWENVTYIEPFVGGGAMLFHMLQTHSNIKSAIINDINADLTMCYKVVRDNPSDLVKSLQEVQSEYYALKTERERKSFFMAMRDEFNTKSLAPIRNTTLFFFLNRTCFNGLYRVNKSGLFNVPFGRYETPMICDPNTIYADSVLLQNVEILTGDYQETLSHAKGNTLFYFDPPYRPLNNTSSFNDYTKEAFNDFAQCRLKEFCDKVTLKGYKFMLSNSDCFTTPLKDRFFEDLYITYVIDRVQASRMVNAKADKRGKLTELLIHNYIIGSPYQYTAEELFLSTEYKEEIEFALGEPSDDFYKVRFKKDIAKTKKYKEGIYYHATGGLGESGVGRGLYLGKDRSALNNFYNSDGEEGYIQKYIGFPNFIDLTNPMKYNQFEHEAILKYGKDEASDYMKKYTLEKGFDGIRYYDPSTTGEEFVLYNIDKVKLVS